MYDAEDVRTKTIISLLLSSGVRVGALQWRSPVDEKHHYLLWRDLKKLDKYGIYRETVYSGDLEEYVAYTSIEAAHDLDAYKAMRERAGEIITPDSPVFRNHFNASIKESVKTAYPLSSSAYFRSLVAANYEVTTTDQKMMALS